MAGGAYMLHSGAYCAGWSNFRRSSRGRGWERSRAPSAAQANIQRLHEVATNRTREIQSHQTVRFLSFFRSTPYRLDAAFRRLLAVPMSG